MNMKNLFLLLVCGLCFQSVGSFAQGYKIQVNIPQMSNKQVILANYFEGNISSGKIKSERKKRI